MNWSKDFESPFKSDVYFFSTRLELDQKWGTPAPITTRDKEFGAFACAPSATTPIASPIRANFLRKSPARARAGVADLEGQLRTTIIARLTAIFAASDLAFLDLAANGRPRR